jgi:hypothetical protein
MRAEQKALRAPAFYLLFAEKQQKVGKEKSANL